MKFLRYTSILFLVISLSNCKKESPEIQELPEISNFRMYEDTIGATVTILGKNFSTISINNTVIFNSAQANPFYATKDTLKVKVPPGATTARIQVKVNELLCTSKDTFFILTGKWTKMANCPGSGRHDAVGFSVAGNGYISTGTGYGQYLHDTWAFNPLENNWKQVADFPEGNRREAISFSIGNKAYVGFGTNTDTFTGMSDFYEFDPATNVWTKKANIPSGDNNNAVGLTINGKGYIITGGYSKQVLEYSPTSDQWLKKGDFPGESRSASTGFVINNKGYIFGGNHGNGPTLVDLWEYDPSIDKWTRKADITTSIGYEGVGFSVRDKGYVCIANNQPRQIWEYDPSSNKWTKKKHFPGNGSYGSISFVIDNVAYVGAGVAYNNVSNELWRFDPED